MPQGQGTDDLQAFDDADSSRPSKRPTMIPAAPLLSADMVDDDAWDTDASTEPEAANHVAAEAQVLRPLEPTVSLEPTRGTRRAAKFSQRLPFPNFRSPKTPFANYRPRPNGTKFPLRPWSLRALSRRWHPR